MSGLALIWAANVKGLKPASKVVLIQLADFHNKESGRCNPSARRLADDCEMDRATVFRHLTKLEEFGHLTRHNRGDGDGGRGSNQYELHLDMVLGASSRHKERSQIATTPLVAKGGGLSRNVATGVGAQCDRNLTIEPIKEPCASQGDTHTDFFSEFCKVYPRMADEPQSELLFSKAVEGGVDPAMIVAAAAAYAKENVSNLITYLKFSENWLLGKCWENHAPKAAVKVSTDAEILDYYANVVIQKKAAASSTVNPAMAGRLLAAGKVTAEQLKSAGVAA